MLLIPVTLTCVSLEFETSQNNGQQNTSDSELFNHYADDLFQILSVEYTEITDSIIIAKSRSTLKVLKQNEQKDEIINMLRLLSEVAPHLLNGDVFEQDPQSEPYFIDFSRQDLSHSLINIIEMEQLRFWYSNFNQTHFYNFSCEQCSLSGSSFIKATFTEVSFAGSDLRSSDFTQSNIQSAYLEGALLGGATWSNGKLCTQDSIGSCHFQ